jgi:hypothetical protein
MKIKRILLNYLRNEEWFNFFTEFKTFVEEITAEVLDIAALFGVFLSFYRQADDTLEQIRKSNYTSLIEQKDDVRDNTFRGLNDAVHSALRHYDATKRAVAENLITLFEHYSDLADRPYNEETASIYNFIQELREKYASDMATLDLTGWVDELERNNTDFEKTVLDRNKEYAGKTELKMVDLRRKTGRCYLDILERIEALCLIQGDEKFAPFIKTLNANIDRYNNLINRRRGKKDVAAATESEPETND